MMSAQKPRLLFLTFAVGLVAGALSFSGCLYPPSELVLNNQSCTAEGECAAGYECRVGLCVLEGSVIDNTIDEVDGGVVDGGPDLLDGGGEVLPPPRPSGAVAGGGHLQSPTYRATVSVGASSAANGTSASDSFRLTLGAQ